MLVTAAVIAARFGVTRSHVYENPDFYGAIRLGDGPRPRLRYDLDAVLERITCHAGREPSPMVEPAPPRRRRRMGTTVNLLPVRGRSGAA